MSQEPNDACAWQSSANIESLEIRAQILQKIRTFFIERGVLEVETPLLAHATVTDPYIQSIAVDIKMSEFSDEAHHYFLQTSPEYAMKRLLAGGSGSIFQICKAFRASESGATHNPEFTMLEWYHLHCDHLGLMEEVEELLKVVLGFDNFAYFTYKDIFMQEIGLDPHTADLPEFVEIIDANGIMVNIDEGPNARDTAMQLLLTHVIEPKLKVPTFIYDFPVSQAALARIRGGDPSVAERFEVYVQGLEVANGYHELIDFDEHCARFGKDNTLRQELGLPAVTIDNRFLAAVASGLPQCAGVAMGVDRLVMLALKKREIAGVIPFVTELA